MAMRRFGLCRFQIPFLGWLLLLLSVESGSVTVWQFGRAEQVETDSHYVPLREIAEEGIDAPTNLPFKIKYDDENEESGTERSFPKNHHPWGITYRKLATQMRWYSSSMKAYARLDKPLKWSRYGMYIKLKVAPYTEREWVPLKHALQGLEAATRDFQQEIDVDVAKRTLPQFAEMQMTGPEFEVFERKLGLDVGQIFSKITDMVVAPKQFSNSVGVTEEDYVNFQKDNFDAVSVGWSLSTWFERCIDLFLKENGLANRGNTRLSDSLYSEGVGTRYDSNAYKDLAREWEELIGGYKVIFGRSHGVYSPPSDEPRMSAVYVQLWGSSTFKKGDALSFLVFVQLRAGDSLVVPRQFTTVAQFFSRRNGTNEHIEVEPGCAEASIGRLSKIAEKIHQDQSKEYYRSDLYDTSDYSILIKSLIIQPGNSEKELTGFIDSACAELQGKQHDFGSGAISGGLCSALQEICLPAWSDTIQFATNSSEKSYGEDPADSRLHGGYSSGSHILNAPEVLDWHEKLERMLLNELASRQIPIPHYTGDSEHSRLVRASEVYYTLSMRKEYMDSLSSKANHSLSDTTKCSYWPPPRFNAPNKLRAGIVSTVKDPHELKEWISFHLAIGFEHIFVVFDDPYFDIPSMKNLLDEFKLGTHPWRNQITVIPNIGIWRGLLRTRLRFFDLSRFLSTVMARQAINTEVVTQYFAQLPPKYSVELTLVGIENRMRRDTLYSLEDLFLELKARIQHVEGGKPLTWLLHIDIDELWWPDMEEAKFKRKLSQGKSTIKDEVVSCFRKTNNESEDIPSIRSARRMALCLTGVTRADSLLLHYFDAYVFPQTDDKLAGVKFYNHEFVPEKLSYNSCLRDGTLFVMNKFVEPKHIPMRGYVNGKEIYSSRPDMLGQEYATLFTHLGVGIDSALGMGADVTFLPSHLKLGSLTESKEDGYWLETPDTVPPCVFLDDNEPSTTVANSQTPFFETVPTTTGRRNAITVAGVHGVMFPLETQLVLTVTEGAILHYIACDYKQWWRKYRVLNKFSDFWWGIHRQDHVRFHVASKKQIGDCENSDTCQQQAVQYFQETAMIRNESRLKELFQQHSVRRIEFPSALLQSLELWEAQ